MIGGNAARESCAASDRAYTRVTPLGFDHHGDKLVPNKEEMNTVMRILKGWHEAGLRAWAPQEPRSFAGRTLTSDATHPGSGGEQVDGTTY